MFSDPSSADDHELDSLLKRARWSQPEPERVARLDNQWRALRRRRTRFAYTLTATAAVLLLSVAMLASYAWRTTSRAIPPGASDSVASSDSLAPLDSASDDSLPSPRIAVRDPNLHERVFLNSRVGLALQARTSPRASEVDERLEELIALLSADARADVAQRLPVEDDAVLKWENRLWNILSQASDERHLGAARLLAQICTPRSIPILKDLARAPATREIAVVSLAGFASSPELARLARTERDSALQADLLKILLARNTSESVGLYLACLDDPDARSSALAVMAGMPEPPVDLIVPFLQNPRKELRLAAARALAQTNSPEVVNRLGELSRVGFGRQEALIALLLSESPLAHRFLNQARQDLYLMASVQAAELELRTLATSHEGHLQ